MLIPCPANRYQLDHAERLRNSFHTLTGRYLIDPALSPEAAAGALFHAPFVVLSHDTAPDPILTYGNLTALNLFALTWEELIQMPSRLTAEAPNRGSNGRDCWQKSPLEDSSTTTRGYESLALGNSS